MLTEKQKFCIHCGNEIFWDEITEPSFFDPVHGQPRFYIRGECPNRRQKTDTGHGFGLIAQEGPFGPFPKPFGIMDSHPALARYVESQQVVDPDSA